MLYMLCIICIKIINVYSNYFFTSLLKAELLLKSYNYENTQKHKYKYNVIKFKLACVY